MTRRYKIKKNDIDLEYAVRPPKPGTGVHAIDHAELLYTPRAKPAATAPEPVDVSRALGRPPLEWEADLIIETRLQERVREMGILP